MAKAQSLRIAGWTQLSGNPVGRTVHRIVAHSVHLASFLLGDDWLSRRARVAVLRLAGATIARGASLHGGSYVSNPRNLVMGRGSFVNRNCYFDLSAPVVLEDDVTVGHGVTFITIEHVGLPKKRGVDAFRPITLKKGCWVGANATLLPGVTVGPQAVVAAGALVLHDVPAECVVGGVPARIIRTGTDEPAPHA